MTYLAARTNNCSNCYSHYNPLNQTAEPFLRFTAKLCYLIQTMRLMVESYARQLFFCFFFTKNKKAGPARKMMWFLFFFKLLVPQLLLRTDAISSSRVFIRHALNNTVHLKTSTWGLFPPKSGNFAVWPSKLYLWKD